MRPIYRLAPLLFMVLVAVLPFTGCGARRDTPAIDAPDVSPRGRAALTLRWPERTVTRKIPAATESVRVSFWKGDTEIVGKSLNRPASGSPTVTATFDNLPPGNLTVRVAAYPLADAGGVVLAKAESAVAVVIEQTAEVRVALASVIRTLAVATEDNISEYYPDDNVALVLSGRDEAGALIPVAPSDLSFTSSAPGVATVDATGTLHGVGIGDTTLTVREADSGATATLPIRIVKRILYAASGYYWDVSASIVSLYRVEEDARFTPLTPARVKAESYPEYIVQHPRKPYLYVVSRISSVTGGRINQYRIRPDGQLVPLNPPSVEAAIFPANLCITPDGKYAYVNCKWKICQYRVNRDGTLSPLNPFYAGVYEGTNDSFSMIMPPQGGYVVVKTGAIFSYRIGADGQLSKVQMTIDITGNYLLFHPSGKTFYVYRNGYSAYRFNQATGTFSQISGSEAVPLQRVEGMTFLPSGQRVYMTYTNQSTYVMDVDSNGAFHNPVSASPANDIPAYNLVAHPSGRYFYAWYSTGVITDRPECEILEVNPTNGTLTRRGQASPDNFGGMYFYNQRYTSLAP